MRVGIVVHDDAGIEQAVRVEQRLDLAHQRVGFGAPFEFDERRHVAAGAMLGFERTVVGLDDHPAQRVHEAAIAFDFGRCVEVLGEHEVQVAFQRVAENDRFRIAVRGEKRCSSSVASASRSTGNATSSMIAVVPPYGRRRPTGTCPCARSRTARIRRGRWRMRPVRTCAGPTTPLRWCRSGWQRRRSAARVSTSNAAPFGPSERMHSGMPRLFSTERSAARSASSTAATGAAFNAVTARHAVARSSNRISALALSAWSGTVR